ncbi:hypothetical protein N9043_00685 [bacterium]|nr:hypothetical protein [bacterium]
MKGFKIDSIGNVIGTIDWNPVTIKEGEDGESVEIPATRPEMSVFPDDFDDILRSMKASAESRKRFTFASDNVYSEASDDSDDCKWQAHLNEKNKAAKAGFLG